jgi:hypothetical protein
MSREIRVDADVAFIPLTQGYEAVIDVADIGLVQGHYWRVLKSPRRRAIYAARDVRDDDKKSHMILMHRLIAAAPNGTQVDHRDCDGLNNRRCNLRLCTHAENQRNTGLRSDNTSGFKGVRFDKQVGRWRAEIRLDGKYKFLGHFDSPSLASEARHIVAAKIYGDFARLK